MFLILLTTPCPVAANDDTTPSSGPTPAEEPKPLEAWLEGDGVTGDWLGWRTRLANQGFSPYAIWIPEVFHSLHGGLGRKSDLQGLLQFGADIDLGPAIGWKNAGIHASALWIQGDNAPSSDFVGTFDELSNIAGNDGVRLFQLFATQEIQDGVWFFKFGQVALDTDFMISETAVLFMNSNFGPMPIESANTPAPIWPLGALGGLVAWKPHDGVTLRMGVYNGDAGTQSSNRHGLEYPFGKSQGVMVLGELELKSNRLGRDGTYQVGGYYHSGEFDDFDTGRTVSDNYAIYLIIDQVLIGSRDDNLLSAFFRAGWTSLDDRNAVRWYLDGGFSVRGFRAGDRVGLGVSHASFGNAFVDSIGASGAPVVDDETILELTYDAQLTPWLSLQPDLQIVIDPFQESASDALVGALRGRITF